MHEHSRLQSESPCELARLFLHVHGAAGSGTVGCVVGDDVGEDVVDVGVDDARAREGGAQLVHQGPEPPVEGLRQLVRELGAGRAGRRVRVPLVRDAADRPHVHHHDLAGVQEVQPLQTHGKPRL